MLKSLRFNVLLKSNLKSSLKSNSKILFYMTDSVSLNNTTIIFQKIIIYFIYLNLKKRIFFFSLFPLSKKKTFTLKEKYPYYLGNEPVFANTKLTVTDKFTLKDATKVAQADAETIAKGIVFRNCEISEHFFSRLFQPLNWPKKVVKSFKICHLTCVNVFYKQSLMR